MKKTGSLIFEVMILLFAAGCAGRGRPQEGGTPFDYYIDCTTREDIEGLEQEPFVEGVFPFTLMIFQRPGYDKPMEGQIAILAAPSFDRLEISPFDPAGMKAEDRTIMQDPGKNPILIDDALAKAEKLSVGDTFYQETKITDTPMEFTVAGIYAHPDLFAQFEAIALINDQIEQVFSERVEELGYTNAYVKAADPAALKAYFDNDFIPHLEMKGLSEEEIAAIPRDELKAYYEDYRTHMDRMH